MDSPSCTAPGCIRRAHAKGLCGAHYKRAAIGADLRRPIQIKRKKAIPGWTAEQVISAELQDANPGGCIEWTGPLDDDGYGLLQVDGIRYRVHRKSYEIAYGPIAGDLLVRHSCDNPQCFNPRHLLLGTPKDNTWDSVERRRNNHGERHHFTPFTEQDIRRIRDLHATGRSIRSLSREFSVARNAIANIVHRRSWKHVT